MVSPDAAAAAVPVAAGSEGGSIVTERDRESNRKEFTVTEASECECV